MQTKPDGTRVISTRAYVSALRELVQEGKEANMVVWGASMNPFLGHNRDRIFFSAPTRPLRRGDMVFYQRITGDFIMHRVLRVKDGRLYIVGDAQTAVEGPVHPAQVFAVVTKVQRKGRLLDEHSLLWKFFQGPWLTLRPLRPYIMKAYGMLRRRK